MTPPAKWFIDKEDESIFFFLCISAPSSSNTPGSVERQGIVRDIKSGLAKGPSIEGKTSITFVN